MTADMSAFSSRLHFFGDLTFLTAHRIGAEQSQAVDAPKLPILRTMDGLPYIPGSSFKGAWRSYTESILRTLQAQPGLVDNLACLPLAEKERCLTPDVIRGIKNGAGAGASQEQSIVDARLRDASCWTCRVFGNGQLAAKVLVKDLYIDPARYFQTEIRDGVAIDRDSGRAKGGQLYQFETVPAGAAFSLEILVENATPAECGLVMLGLNAFIRGEVLLGGAKSRGLGWCKLEPKWEQSEYVTADDPDDLLAYLFRPADTEPVGLTGQESETWVSAFREAIQVKEGKDA